MGNLGILQALIFEPRKAFAQIAERPKFWFPLLVLLIALLGTTVWYLSTVDIGWMADRQLRHSFLASRLTEDQITQQVQAAQARGRGLQIGISVVAVVIFLPIGMMIFALYNYLVGKMVNFERSFGQWFSFTAWVAALPAALGAILGGVVLATAGTSQLAQESLKPLSLNALFFHRAIGDPGFSFLSYLDLFQLFALYLSLLGVKLWSGRSWLFSILFVGIPWVLIYGIWAWISLR